MVKRTPNKTLFAETFKQLTLKATASAMVSLHAKAMAVSCPAFITDTSLAGIVCDFDTGSSITVENGGLVGGINMASYSPVPASHITINAGGVVNNITGIGINISASSLSNGILNSGTISSTNAAIFISNASTVSSGISNTGMMSSTSGTGILITDTSTVTGGISNSGTITAESVFVGVTINNNSFIDGGITNTGSIEVDNGSGILMRSNSSINGGISNAGIISSIGNTGISVLNVATIQGNISNNGLISGGTKGIAIHNGSFVNGDIVNNGLINGGQNGISIFSATTINGSISNTGTINSAQDGLFISSSATVNGGISNSGIIQGSIHAITISSDSLVSAIDILGQSARIIGAVDASSTTVNVTSGSLFTSEGTYNVNAFNIGANALFNMANTITAFSVNNSGTLSITNTLQTLVGDYTQLADGLFQTRIAGANDYGQLSVSGAVDLSQSGNMYVLVDQNASIHQGDVLSNIISGTTLTGPSNGFNVDDNSYVWTFLPAFNATNNGINLTARINPDAYNVCRGSYCQGAATAILSQIAAGNPLFSLYTILPNASAFQEAVSQASPELSNENNQLVQLITRSVVDVLPMWDTLRGRSAGDAMLYQPGKVWLKPYGASMTQNEYRTVPGFNAHAYGAVIGKDIQLTNDWLFGGGLAAGGDTMHGKSVLNGQSMSSHAYQALLYAAKKLPHHVYFAGQGLVGYELNNSNRTIPLYASTATGSYTSWFTNLRAEAGWNTYALSPHFVFTPSVDASYLFIHQNAYQEWGSPMNLLVASNHYSSLVLGAYANGAYHLPNSHFEHDLTLRGYAGLAGDVINKSSQVNATFLAGGASFSTVGIPFNELVFRGGAGLTLTKPSSPLLIELNYDLQVGNNAHSGIGSATLKYKT